MFQPNDSEGHTMKYDELCDWLFDFDSYSPYQEKLNTLLQWHTIRDYNSNLTYDENVRNGVNLPPIGEAVVLKTEGGYEICEDGVNFITLQNGTKWKYLGWE